MLESYGLQSMLIICFLNICFPHMFLFYGTYFSLFATDVEMTLLLESFMQTIGIMVMIFNDLRNTI